MAEQHATRRSRNTEGYLAPDSLAASLTRLELAVMRSHAAFSRWAPELHNLVSGDQLSYQDCAVLHCIRLRGGSTTLAEMLIFLHRHDLAAVQYSLRKLEKTRLVRKAKGPQRREIYYSLTDLAIAQTNLYGERRQDLLIDLCRDINGLEASMSVASSVLERLTSLYDQAVQSVLNQHLLNAAPRFSSDESDAVLPVKKRTSRN